MQGWSEFDNFISNIQMIRLCKLYNKLGVLLIGHNNGASGAKAVLWGKENEMAALRKFQEMYGLILCILLREMSGQSLWCFLCYPIVSDLFLL